MGRILLYCVDVSLMLLGQWSNLTKEMNYRKRDWLLKQIPSIQPISLQV